MLADLSMLDAALLCAERGLHVIPVHRMRDGVCTCSRGTSCPSPGKHPTIDSWQTSATIDLTVIRDWFSDDRNNLGVVCGKSNVCVIDVDPRNGGHDTFAALVADLGPLPHTVTSDSGGGGQHYIFRRPPGDLVSKLGPGVDFLRDARQFCVEPSLHASGNRYRWREGRAPDEITIATLPETWLRKVRRAPSRPSAMPPIITTDARVERARRYLARIPGAVSGSGGHTQTFNAVAAVMFGFDLDADTTYSIIASDYNPRCSPVWSEKELLHKIRSVAENCKRERGYLLDANRGPVHTTEQAAHAAPEAPPESDDTPWSQRILYNDKNKPKRGYHNVLAYVRHHPDYAGKWSLNTMTGDVWFAGSPTRDSFVHDIRAQIDSRLGFSPGRDDVDAAILTCAEARPFHPIQHYLRSIDWDGTERLSAMARDYFGSDDALHAELVRKWMISAVARALVPGCKVDTALMLFGEQGYYKSSFFAILGGAWHADSPIDISNKDSFQQIHAAWIYEFAELENVVTGARESRLKAWLTSSHDMFRAPYARAVSRRPRSCVIGGSTNRQQFLTDETGSRRFWIVPVSRPIDRHALADCRDQLWAEAVCAYEAGETWWLDRDADAVREQANADYVEEDPWMTPISDWLAISHETTMSQILRDGLKIDVPRFDRASQIRVGRIVKLLGWEKVRVRTGRLLRWVYRKP